VILDSKGKLMLIGGHVDKGTSEEGGFSRPSGIRFFELDILKRLVRELKDREGRIEIISSASEIPEEIGEEYKKAFNRINFPNTGLLHLGIKENPDDKEVIKRIEICAGLIFTGGSQEKLMKIIGNKRIAEIIKKRYFHDKDFIVSGTSAGAMVLSEIMISGGTAVDALFKGNVKLGKGLGLSPDLIIDTHFIQRGRFGRLIEAVTANPGKMGVGLGENTAVLLKNEKLEIVGSNLVVIIDGKKITKNNYNNIKTGEGILAENINIHVLPKNSYFNLKDRKVY
jgi:cyanophycinase